MRYALLALSLVLAAQPAHAASKLKKFKKLLVCGVTGEQNATVDLEGKGKALVSTKEALDASAKTLAAELSAAGIGMVPFADAAAAAEARMDRKEKAMEGQLDDYAATAGAAAGGAEIAGMNAAMQAAMNNPALTPEMREQMRKAFGASAGQAAAGTQAKVQSGNVNMMKAAKAGRKAQVGKDGSPSTWHARQFCPEPKDAIFPDAPGDGPSDRGEAFAFLDEVGADGWLFVDAKFGESITTVTEQAWKLTQTSFNPRWVYEVKYYDKKGKMVWGNRKPIRSKDIKLGKTAAGAQKAVDASARDSMKTLVAEMTK
ncbi:MAG: hypothetical protein HYZ75_08725 [Elusimicrobia bacterium]|nr:hypothetical protein [Elusimicrobiota bacterium]